MIRYVDVPREAKDALKPHLKRWGHLIPSWCHELTVAWKPLDEDAEAQVECEIEYRRATLTVNPTWLHESEAARAIVIRHELLHLVLEPMALFTQEMLKRCVADDSAFSGWIQDQWRICYEGTVEDFARALSDARSR